jgi:hypothetical protein
MYGSIITFGGNEGTYAAQLFINTDTGNDDYQPPVLYTRTYNFVDGYWGSWRQASVPEPPQSGSYTLKCREGVMAWVIE